MLKNKALTVGVAVVLSFVLVYFALLTFGNGDITEPSSQPPTPSPTPTATPTPTPTPTPPPDVTVTLTASGDNLIHDVIYLQAGRRAENGGYDFTFAYENVADLFTADNVNFINQETPLATTIAPPSNYPLFNTPIEMADHLESMNFHVVCHANNHMFDQGESGLRETFKQWEGTDILPIGMWENESEMSEPLLYARDGITFGWVPLADHTNGLSLPSGSEMEYILTSDIERITEQVELAKASADVVVVSVHWGNENVHTVTAAQTELANNLASMGVDIILGHHSHTIAPTEWIETKNGSTLVVYSLGNFISAMLDAQNMLGNVLSVDITKDGSTGDISLSNVTLTPVVTHFGPSYANLTIHKLSDYTDELASAHGIRSRYPSFSVDYLTNTYLDYTDEEFRVELS